MSVPAMPCFDKGKESPPGTGCSGLAGCEHLRSALAAGPCDPPVTNPIVCENSLPGSDPTDWGTGSDPSIIGFSTGISVNEGGIIGFKVNTDSRNYLLTIYLLG